MTVKRIPYWVREGGIGIEVNGTNAGGGATNVTVRDVKVERFQKGIQYDDEGGGADGDVTNVNVTDNGYGLFGLGGVSVNVTKSEIVFNTIRGAQAYFSDSRFEDNLFKNNGGGMYLLSVSNKIVDNEFVDNSRAIRVTSSTVRGNLITSSTQVGITGSGNDILDNNISYNRVGIRTPSPNTIRGNQIVGNNRSGINVTGGDGTVVDDNLVTDNNRDGSYAGILVRNSDNVELTDNRVHRNAIYGVKAVNTDGTILRGNRVTENCGGTAGVYFGGTSNNTVLESNNVSNNTGLGIRYAASGSNVTIRNVTANDNGDTGIWSSEASGRITNVEVNRNAFAGLITGGTTVRNIEARNNTNHGFVFAAGAVTADNVTAVGNNQTGIYLVDGANPTVVRDSVVRLNGFGNTVPAPTGVSAGGSDHTGVFAKVDDVVIEDSLVTDNDADVRTTANNTTLRNVDIGSANLSGEATDVKINETVSPDPTPSNHTGVGAYFNVTNVTGTAYFDTTVTYSQAGASGIDESTLSVWRDEGAWNELGGAVDISTNEVTYNITEFGVLGVFADEALFTQPLIGKFVDPPTNTGELNATLYEDLDGDGDGKSVV